MSSKKILFLTGASSDIGVGFINHCHNEFDLIYTHYFKSKNRIENLKALYGEKIVPFCADLSDVESVYSIIENVDKNNYPTHIVHLAAPNIENKSFSKTEWSDFQNNINSSLKSIIILLKFFLPQMAKRHYGKILFMLSSYIVGTPPKYQSPYITTKYALFGLMKNLASEYAEKGISINGISAEMINTRFLDNIPRIVKEINIEKMPMKRNLETGDVIPLMKFLLSDSSDMITGQNIGITGGVNLHNFFVMEKMYERIRISV